ELYMGSSDRFSSVSVGLGIPIFARAQRVRIQAARVALQQATATEDATRKAVYNQLENLLVQYHQLHNRLRLYDNGILPNQAQTLLSASQKLEAGDIDYLQWVLLTNQVFAARAAHLQTIRQVNEVTILIEELTAIKKDHE